MYNIKFYIIVVGKLCCNKFKSEERNVHPNNPHFAYRDGRGNVDMTFFFLHFPLSLSAVKAGN
jgi:hypothetical protein